MDEPLGLLAESCAVTSGCVLIQVRVQPSSESVEALLDVVEPRIDPVETSLHPGDQRIEPNVRPRRERIDASSQVEQRPERRGGEQPDRGPDGGVHLEGERSTEV
jgi:hypothetical protein